MSLLLNDHVLHRHQTYKYKCMSISSVYIFMMHLMLLYLVKRIVFMRLDCTHTCHFWPNVPWWWFRVFNGALELMFGFCVSSPAPLRNTNMAIIWICLASVTGLVTFLAVVICRKRQEEYFELSAFISPAFLCIIYPSSSYSPFQPCVTFFCRSVTESLTEWVIQTGFVNWSKWFIEKKRDSIEWFIHKSDIRSSEHTKNRVDV